MPRQLVVLACWLSLGMAAIAMACNDDNGGSPTATSILESTATAVPTLPSETATPAPDIRQEDLTQQAGLQEFLATSGGQVTPDSILYADVTDDGADDAIIPVGSGGEGGNIALFVYGYQAAGLEELLRVTTPTRLTASVDGGVLLVTEASFGPNDPLCCPNELKTTSYRWDGSRLAAEEQTP